MCGCKQDHLHRIKFTNIHANSKICNEAIKYKKVDNLTLLSIACSDHSTQLDNKGGCNKDF